MKDVFTESINGRASQDTAVFYALADITGEDAKLHLTELGNKVAEAAVEQSKISIDGTCYISTITTSDGLIQGECCGDSQATLYIYNPTTGVSHKVLHQLHNPLVEMQTLDGKGAARTEDENARLALLNKHTHGAYLEGVIAVSRAFGDNRFEVLGLNHEREFFVEQLNLAEGERAFLMTSCDGLFECCPSAKLPDAYKALIKESIEKGEGVEQIGKAISPIAKTTSKDDLTFSFYEVGIPRKNAVVSVVCDGHAGNELAKKCAESARSFAKANGGQDIQMFIEAAKYTYANVEKVEVQPQPTTTTTTTTTDNPTTTGAPKSTTQPKPQAKEPQNQLMILIPTLLGVLAIELLAEHMLANKVSSTALKAFTATAQVVEVGLLAACVYSYLTKDSGKSKDQELQR